MSFILDALKKSEHERQRQSTPGMIEMPAVVRRRGVPAWVWVLAALLGVNVAVLFLLLLRGGAPGSSHGSGSEAAPGGAKPAAESLPQVPSTRDPAAALEEAQEAARAAALAAANQAVPVPPAADHFSPMDDPPQYAPEIPVQDDAATAAAVTPEIAAGARAGAAPRATRKSDAGRDPGRDPVLNDEPPDEMLPSISELNLTGNQTLPEINIDVHVYASRPADRFVYVNMRKYREGAVLQEGPTLERIRRDGVVLNYNGLRFFVPRQ